MLKVFFFVFLLLNKEQSQFDSNRFDSNISWHFKKSVDRFILTICWVIFFFTFSGSCYYPCIVAFNLGYHSFEPWNISLENLDLIFMSTGLFLTLIRFLILYSHISFYLIDDIYSDNCTSSKLSYDVDKWMKVVQSIARGKKIICQTGLVHQPVCRIIIFTTMTCIVLFLRSF